MLTILTLIHSSQSKPTYFRPSYLSTHSFYKIHQANWSFRLNAPSTSTPPLTLVAGRAYALPPTQSVTPLSQRNAVPPLKETPIICSIPPLEQPYFQEERINWLEASSQKWSSQEMTQMWLLSRYEGQRIPRHFPQTKLRTKSKREGKAVERDLDFFLF